MTVLPLITVIFLTIFEASCLENHSLKALWLCFESFTSLDCSVRLPFDTVICCMTAAMIFIGCRIPFCSSSVFKFLTLDCHYLLWTACITAFISNMLIESPLIPAVSVSWTFSDLRFGLAGLGLHSFSISCYLHSLWLSLWTLNMNAAHWVVLLLLSYSQAHSSDLCMKP